MNVLGPLAGLLGIEIESITTRVRNTIILNALLIAFAIVGVGFLVAAGFLALADAVGGIYAALILAGSFLLIALVIYLTGKMNDGRHRRAIVEKRRSTETSAFVTTAAITALPVLLKSPLLRTIGLPAAALAAFLMFKGGSRTPKD